MDGFPSTKMVEAALRAMGVANVTLWGAVLAAACQKHGINTPARVAAFLANVGHESGGFSALVENLNYANDRLVAVFGGSRGGAAAAMKLGRPAGSSVPLTQAQQRLLACSVYGGPWGLKNLGNRLGTTDGWDRRGMGLIQLTGYANHLRFAKAIGVDVEALPALLTQPEGAADSAAAFWTQAGCNEAVDRADLTGARRLVNGGILGLEEVLRYTAKAKAALTATVVP